MRIEELHKSYALPDIVKMINSRKVGWAGQAARMGRRGMHPHILWTTRGPARSWENNIKLDLKRKDVVL